jgi:hypothetical protein
MFQTLYTDQYQMESLQQLALEMGMVVEGVDFTAKSKAKIFGNLQQLFNQQKIELLDSTLNSAANTLEQELVQLQKRLTPMGSIQISAPEGKHDDMACVLALAARQAMWLDQSYVAGAEERQAPSLHEMGMTSLDKHRRVEEYG